MVRMYLVRTKYPHVQRKIAGLGQCFLAVNIIIIGGRDGYSDGSDDHFRASIGIFYGLDDLWDVATGCYNDAYGRLESETG